MKKAGILLGVVGLLLLAASCATTEESVKTTVTTGGPGVKEVAAYQGPKARVGVASFKIKAAKAGGDIGEGMTDALVSALFRSNRFIVLERGETLNEIKEELNLTQSGYTEAGKAAAKGTWEGADILVMGAVTAFEPEAAGTGGGGLVIPLPAKFGGGFRISKNEAYVAAELRLVDVRTTRVLNTARVEGKASNFKVGGFGGALIGSVVLAGGLEKYRNTPMEKALMVMLDNAVNEIVKSVPEDYYRYAPATK